MEMVLAKEQSEAAQKPESDSTPIDFSGNTLALKFSGLVADMRSAVIRDFPELAPNIYIVDPTKPIDEEITRAAAQLNMPNLRERIERQSDVGASVLTNKGVPKSGGVELPFWREDTDDKFTDPRRDSRYVGDPTEKVNHSNARANFNAVIVFPGYPADIAALKDNNKRYDFAIEVLFHETGHAISLIHPEFKQRVEQLANNGMINKVVYDQLTETFASTFALDAGKQSGLMSDDYINRNMANWDTNLRDPWLSKYNPTDEYAFIRQKYPADNVLSYQGIPDLSAVFSRALEAQQKNLSDKDSISAIRLSEALTAANKLTDSTTPRDSEYDLGPKAYAKVEHEVSKTDELVRRTLPFSERIEAAREYVFAERPSGNYHPAGNGPPIDVLRVAAELWVANTPDQFKTDRIVDDEIQGFVRSALKSYVKDQPYWDGATSITPEMIDNIASHINNKTWAREFLAGRPIDRALENGTKSIAQYEADHPHPGHGLPKVKSDKAEGMNPGN